MIDPNAKLVLDDLFSHRIPCYVTSVRAAHARSGVALNVCEKTARMLELSFARRAMFRYFVFQPQVPAAVLSSQRAVAPAPAHKAAHSRVPSLAERAPPLRQRPRPAAKAAVETRLPHVRHVQPAAHNVEAADETCKRVSPTGVINQPVKGAVRAGARAIPRPRAPRARPTFMA